ncbi:MAG: hypothetical protein J1E05_06640 [Eubacterium sp.]|nr:hypothetical protein [Eubacterium sp.]
MKKLLVFLLTLALCLGFAVTAFAEESVDGSTPRLVVSSYKLDKDFVKPGEKTTLKINLKNYSSTKALKNIWLSLSDDSGDIRPDGMGTQYVKSIKAGGTYTWEIDLNAVKTAQEGEHRLNVSVEYEDKAYMSYSTSSILMVTVRQTVALDYDGAVLPAKVIQDSTETVSINLMNTGKSDLRNCKIDFDIEGLESGGTAFVGEIPAGQSSMGSANLRVSSTMLGDVAGTIKISYEDEFGESYSKTVDVSTTIAEKVVVNTTQTEEEEDSNSLWWLYGLIGLAAGGGIGCAIPLSIISFKKRREDEKRL